MCDNAERVHRAMTEGGMQETSNPESQLAALNHAIDILTGLKEKIEAGNARKLGMSMSQFRDVLPCYDNPSRPGEPSSFRQRGPSVTRIVVLDYKKAGQELS